MIADATGAQMLRGSAWDSPLVFLIEAEAIECLADKSYSRCRASERKARARAASSQRTTILTAVTSENPPMPKTL
ncbi:hypothetical protein PSEUDO8BK_30349 [Pseudomonas sp. 8BK]|nr:hypothetical protein PSEUDO8BK_30349 [Pseudomonas sp. 8BK]